MNNWSVNRVLNYLYYSDCRLLFLLIVGRWFRLGFSFCLLLVIGVPFCCWKLFDSTPQEVNPEYKMSVVDFIQAKALARSARNLSVDLELEQRFGHWRMAIGNDPGNLALNRAYLDSLLRFDRLRRYWHDGIRTTLWLQKLSGTNWVDLDLSCRIYEYYGLDQMVIETIEAQSLIRSEALRSCYLRALFHRGRIEEFGEHWAKASDQFRERAGMKLYETAFRASSENSSDRNEGQAVLDAAKLNQSMRRTAHRLQLRVSSWNGDWEAFELSFGYLEDRADTLVSDHGLRWDLLVRLGRSEDAKAAAIGSLIRPRTSFEVLEISDALMRLELRPLALAFLKNYATEFGFREANWCAQANGLIEEQAWDGLVRLALEIRSSSQVTYPMMAYSYFLEGKGESERGREWAAALAFQQIDAGALVESHLGVYVGSNLWGLGFGEKAFDVLWRGRLRNRERTAVWELLWEISSELSIQQAMFVTAENLCRLNPDNVLYRVNYASLLVSQRIRIDRALAILFDAYTQYPENLSVRINYGQALILCGRDREAVAFLRDIDPAALDATQLQGLNTAWTELYYTQNRFEEAWDVGKQVIAGLLLPSERVYFERIRRDLAMRFEEKSPEVKAKPESRNL